MRAIIRKLFGERTEKHKDKAAKRVFSKDMSIKILQLIARYNITNKDQASVILYNEIETRALFLERLNYHVPVDTIANFYDLNQIINFLDNCTLSKYLDVIELHALTLFEVSLRLNMQQYFFEYIDEFNNLMGLYSIPFKLVFNEQLNKVHIEEINTQIEENNKQDVYSIIKDESEVNKYFIDAITDYAKKRFPESIENAYLALEQYLKDKTGNKRLDASDNYVEFNKKYSKNYKGIFKVRPKIIKDKIDCIYGIRSEIKGHSPKGTFNTQEFLEETARFQLNEVMACIILLEHLTRPT